MIDKDKLYDWQKEAFKSWTDNGCKGLIESCTASGKTLFALFCMQTIRKSTLIIVPTIALQRQWKEEVLKNLDVTEDQIGLIGDGKFEIKPITIAVINSLRGRKISMFQCYVLDEVHNMASFENIKPLVCIKGKPSLGITATLERTDNRHKMLFDYIGDVVYTYEQKDAIDDDILSKFTLVNVGCDMPLNERKAYDELDMVVKNGMNYFGYDFPRMQKAVRNFRNPESRVASKCLKAIGERRKLYSNSFGKEQPALDIIEKHKGEQILVFNEYIGMAERLYDKLVERNYKVGIYHSGSKKAQTIKDFSEGKINVLVSVKSLAEGLNVVGISTGISISSNNVRRATIQKLGRVIRKHKDKKAYYYQLYCKNTKEQQDINKKVSMLSHLAEKIEWQ